MDLHGLPESHVDDDGPDGADVRLHHARVRQESVVSSRHNAVEGLLLCHKMSDCGAEWHSAGDWQSPPPAKVSRLSAARDCLKADSRSYLLRPDSRARLSI